MILPFANLLEKLGATCDNAGLSRDTELRKISRKRLAGKKSVAATNPDFETVAGLWREGLVVRVWV
ncbi:MAG: hypothetical protein LUD52_03785, partial [Opitutae bacterium]|nr:hypothetical protein [Opitutae bacterium]